MFKVKVDVGSDNNSGSPFYMRFIKMAIPTQASTPKEAVVN